MKLTKFKGKFAGAMLAIIGTMVACDSDYQVQEEELIVAYAEAPEVLLNTNPGFEEGLTGWSTYKAPSIANDAIIRVDNNGNAKFGNKHLFMRLPASATINGSEYINLGQTLNLSSTKRYRYSAWVKWANPNNSLPSAIISIWARNQDGSYNGQDVWITDGNDYKYLTFEFTPNETGNVFCYISLLTHQNGFDNTDIFVDALRIEEIGDAIVDVDPRPANQNLLSNSFFSQDFANWTTTSYNPHNVSGLNKFIVNDNGNKRMRLELPGASNNTYLNETWIGAYQEVTLYAGNKYVLEANIDRVVPDALQYETIVNLYALKPETPNSPRAWLGDVDYKFNKSENHFYSQVISPTETTTYNITARVFGWANEGNPVSVNFDNIKVKRIE
ncbi:hypothetical protein HX109_13160 [Galbibacter sp. BG1]|uniref:hypothetical protein n=1 Tax=Galbibacter sp. BG1 TaxID=1170699 RepID=UPI0015BEF271|nr:hypothetical protein [Galbibacter sp. BG1]QLE02459.1 hypothetical protein HX109_13160 [Galbibacter sp. BG1]